MPEPYAGRPARTVLRGLGEQKCSPGYPNPGIKPSLCAGKTGKWLQMQVLYVEDLANHDDPESCVGIRKDDGEALTGEHAGRVLSREKFTVQGADAVEISGRQHGLGRQGEPQPDPAWSETSRTRGSHLFGNRELLWLAVRESPSRAVRIGKVAPVIR